MNIKECLYHWIAVLLGLMDLVAIFPSDFYHLRYYTNLSNFVVMGFYGYIIINNKSLTNRELRIKTGVTITITLTFVIYNLLLLPQQKTHQIFQMSNLVMHEIVPLMVILDCLIHDGKTYYRHRDPLIWAIFPMVYCIASVFVGLMNWSISHEKASPFSYFFLNVSHNGWMSLITYIAIITICYVGLGYVMRFLR